MNNSKSTELELTRLLAQRLRTVPVSEWPTQSVIDLMSESEGLAVLALQDAIASREGNTLSLPEGYSHRSWRPLRAATVDFTFVCSALAFVASWLLLGLNHVTVYLGASVALLVAALQKLQRRPDISRVLLLLASLALPDAVAYWRLRQEGSDVLSNTAYAEAFRFPPLLIAMDLAAYGVLLVFIVHIFAYSKTRHFAAQRAKHRAMRSVAVFAGIAVAYWITILVGIWFGGEAFGTVRALIHGVWGSDVGVMAGLVFALYGTTALVAWSLPRWDEVGYPAWLKWVRHVLRLDSVDSVSLADTGRWLAVPTLAYCLFGTHVGTDAAGLAWRALGGASVVALGFLPWRARSGERA